MTTRRILAEVDANRRPGCQLSEGQKISIVRRRDQGESLGEIARCENLPKPTVQSVLRRATQRGTIANAPRTGRPSVITPAARRAIIRLCREEPTITLKRLINEAGYDISRNTTKRLIKHEGFAHEPAKRRPYLTEEHTELRLQFAYNHEHTDWSNWLFSDECSLEYGRGQKPLWAFNKTGERYEKTHVQPYLKGPQQSLMIWAVIGLTYEDCALYIMNRDADSPRGGYSAASYIATLEEGLIPYYGGQVFMQDGAKIHTARKTMQYLEEQGVDVLRCWPPFSPDLNPIEHLWARLKDDLYAKQPHLLEPRTKRLQKDALLEFAPEVWVEISQDVVEGVIKSMPDRIRAVIAAHGWHTKY